MNQRSRQILKGFVDQHGWTRGAEIGVLKGATFFYLLDHCHELAMIGVDIWEPRPGAADGWTYEGDNLPAHYQRIRDLIQKVPYAGRATLIREWSSNAAAQVPDGSLDFIFIDADHTEPGIRADIVAWAPKVTPDGWLIGHDYCPQFPDVIRVVDALLPGVATWFDSLWSIPKAETRFAGPC